MIVGPKLLPPRSLKLQRHLESRIPSSLPRSQSPADYNFRRALGPAPGYGSRSEPRDVGLPIRILSGLRLQLPACRGCCSPSRRPTAFPPQSSGPPKWRAGLRRRAEWRRRASRAAAALVVRSSGLGNMHFSIPETESRSGDSGGSAYVVRSCWSWAGAGLTGRSPRSGLLPSN